MERVFFALAMSLVLALFMVPVLIPLLHKLKFGQSIRSDGPQGHFRKAGTPTMGGIIFLLAVPVSTILFSDGNWEVLLALWVTLGFGLIGFLDDFIKVVLKRSLGLTARQKLAGQLLVSSGLAVGAIYLLGLEPSFKIPFISWEPNFGLVFYLVFTTFVVVGTTNAVNLTDGLDGLATGVTVFAAGAYIFVSIFTGQFELAVFLGALVGAALGFLKFNRHPARVFMGDTGSLALGGALAAAAVITKTQFFLPIIGGIYFIEALSVIIQVISFKLTGKRVFRMSPLHHHFELAGWPETKVVRRFWLFSLIFAGLGLSGLFINII